MSGITHLHSAVVSDSLAVYSAVRDGEKRRGAAAVAEEEEEEGERRMGLGEAAAVIASSASDCASATIGSSADSVRRELAARTCTAEARTHICTERHKTYTQSQTQKGVRTLAEERPHGAHTNAHMHTQSHARIHAHALDTATRYAYVGVRHKGTELHSPDHSHNSAISETTSGNKTAKQHGQSQQSQHGGCTRSGERSECVERERERERE